MITNIKPQIVLIDDKITESNYPLVNFLKREYGGEYIHIFQDPNEGIKFITDNLGQKMIVLLDIMFGDKAEGFRVLETILEKSKLVSFIIMSGNPEKIKVTDLLKFINGQSWYFVQRDKPSKQIMKMIKDVEYDLDVRIDCALEEWILNHPDDTFNKPYMTTKSGNIYTLNEILVEIRKGNQSSIGLDFQRKILLTAIDLLTRNKRQLDD